MHNLRFGCLVKGIMFVVLIISGTLKILFFMVIFSENLVPSSNISLFLKRVPYSFASLRTPT